MLSAQKYRWWELEVKWPASHPGLQSTADARVRHTLVTLITNPAISEGKPVLTIKVDCVTGRPRPCLLSASSASQHQWAQQQARDIKGWNTPVPLLLPS